MARPIFLLLIAVFCTSSAQKCFSCASPSLRTNWMLTGLPKIPTSPLTPATASFFGEANCAVTVAGTTPTALCTSACITLFIPTGGNEEYDVVRGCFTDFFADTGNAVPPTIASCRVYQIPATSQMSVASTCLPTATETSTCNAITVADATLNCRPDVTAVNCNKCVDRYGQGECSTGRFNRTVPGPVCSKIKGKVDGYDYVELGTAWFIPSVSDAEAEKCFTKIATTAGSEPDGILFNTPKTFEGDMCYCRTDRCNFDNGTYPNLNDGAPGQLSILFTLVPVLFVLPLLSLQ